MYNDSILAYEEEHKKRSMILSIVLHLLLLLICFLPLFWDREVPEDQLSGILVQLGTVDGGSEQQTAASADQEEDEESKPVQEQAEVDESSAPEIVEKQQTKAVKESRVAKVETNTTTDEAEIIAARKEAEARKIAEKEAEEDRKAKAAAEKKEQERKTAEEAAKKKAEYDAKKSKFGSLLSGGDSNNSSSGSQGDPDGDPNSKALQNLATGAGMIGDGLSNRDIIYKPEIKDDSQKTGRVVIDICINKAGKVISAKYTQSGSTTTDKDLIDVSEVGVRKYRFSASDIDKQCGSIIIDFKLK